MTTENEQERNTPETEQRKRITELEKRKINLVSEISDLQNTIEGLKKINREMRELISSPPSCLLLIKRAIDLARQGDFYGIKTALQVHAVRCFNLVVTRETSDGEWGPDIYYSLICIPTLFAHDVPDHFEKYYSHICDGIITERGEIADSREDDLDNDEVKELLSLIRLILGESAGDYFTREIFSLENSNDWSEDDWEKYTLEVNKNECV